ncbi:MAG: hypothetical protein AAGA23_12765 [Pseudomonadota bacterium]
MSDRKLDGYFKSFGERLRQRQVRDGLAVLLTGAAVLTLLATGWLVSEGFPQTATTVLRSIGLLLLGAGVWFLVLRPQRRLGTAADPEKTQAYLVRQLEAKADFGGRLETYRQTAATNPLRSLLAADALSIARRHAPDELLPPARLRWPALVAGLGAAALLALLILGPGLYGYGARHLWAGWLLPDLLPPQSLSVSPGDSLVRRGGRLVVQARPEGFTPDEAELFARVGEGEWQSTPMVADNEAFRFTFPAVREPVRYYVVAGDVRSPEFGAEVIDLPRIVKFDMTYHYPPWSGREPETVRGGDVRAVAETRVELQLETEAALPASVLRLSGRDTVALEIDGVQARVSFSVDGDGEYSLAALAGGDEVRLTPDYLITELPDEPPELSFSAPARDVDVHAVEELPLTVQATDDFSLREVTLHYAVNGGDWQEVPLARAETRGTQVTASHLLMLEDLGEFGFLEPGDVISYFASASDRSALAQSDLFFVHVRPFDRRVSQSQMAGGGSGGGEQNEISQRQREIILSTWNLRRQRDNDSAEPAQISDRARLLAQLQETLAGQAETLADRVRARQLSADQRIATYIGHLEDAIANMGPAAERLTAEEFAEALAPEQLALKHLLRAEAVFTDIQVSMNSNRSRGSGSGRDLAEMMELELDLEKNQYETAERASPAQAGGAEDDTLDQLEDLARRQQELADAMAGNSQATPAQRWQQERLRREVEELREELRRQARSQSQSQSAQSQSGQRGESGESSQQLAGGGETGEQRSEMDERTRQELEAQLERAANAMEQLTRQDGVQEAAADGAAGEEAARQALEELKSARDSAARRQAQAMGEAFADLSGRAEDLHERQATLAETLDQALRGALDEDESGDDDDVPGTIRDSGSGLTPMQEYDLARQKRELASELQTLQQDMLNTARRFDEATPEGSQALNEGVADLDRSEAVMRLGVAAEYIEYGAAGYIVSSEDMVTDAMERLADAARDAQRRADQAGAPGQQSMSEALAELSRLRRDLQSLAAGQAPGQTPGQTSGQTPGNQNPGQDSTPGSGEGLAQQELTDARGGDASRGGGAAGSSPRGARIFQPRQINPALAPREVQRQLIDRADQVVDAVRDNLPALAGQAVTPEELRALREMLGEFDLAEFSGNPALLEAELRRLLGLSESLELRLRAAQGRNDRAAVQGAPVSTVDPRYREAVRDYFRRLGDPEDDT